MAQFSILRRHLKCRHDLERKRQKREKIQTKVGKQKFKKASALLFKSLYANSRRGRTMKLENLQLLAKSLQSCPTLCDPTDGSPPGSSFHGILQARTLEWVAIFFSNA